MYLNHRQCKHLQFWSHKFCFTTKGSLSNFNPFFYLKSFVRCKKVVCCGERIELCTHFDFQLITKYLYPFLIVTSECWLISKHIFKTIITKHVSLFYLALLLILLLLLMLQVLCLNQNFLQD